jgi:hypothetical protein
MYNIYIYILQSMNVNMSQGSTNGMLNGIQPNYDFINKYGSNPLMIGILVFIILLYYVVIHYIFKKEGMASGMSSGMASGMSSSSASSSSSVGMIEILLWGMFIMIILLNGVRYFYDLDITTSIKDIFTREPEVDINVTGINETIPTDEPIPVPEIKWRKQVFHVPDNKYSFSDSRAICAAYGGKLASYDQVEKSYKDGAEWCGFGWSENQMALYPTQKKTYNKLQTIKGHEHDCGRPGINGGYIANPNVKFGVNCYGYKPKITSAERKLMTIDKIYPKTKDDLTFEKKIYEWRRKLGEILVAPFNRTTWSNA